MIVAATMSLVTAPLQRSLLIQAQRRTLDKLGQSVGTPVLYLKAAWADPVLYGGRGQRFGGDIDILVRRCRFDAFADALESVGYRLFHDKWHMASHRLLGKAWLHLAPADALPVDLHRDLADRPWFNVPVDEWIDRAVCYQSDEGAIWSLAPEDQVVYAAAHYANHRYSLGPQHLNDVVLMLGQHPVNWQLVQDRARQSDLELPLLLLTEALSQQGGGAPLANANASGLSAWRLKQARRFVGDGLARAGARAPSDYLRLMPFLSGRASALPLFIVQSAVVRALDVAYELRRRLRG